LPLSPAAAFFEETMDLQSFPKDGTASNLEPQPDVGALKASGWGSARKKATNIKPVSEDLVSENDGIIKIHYHKMR